MSKIKIYRTLDQALRDIEFKEGMPSRELELRHVEVHGHCQPSVIELESWLLDNLKERGEAPSGRLASILRELVSNAYLHSVRSSGDSCSVEVYIGGKGMLSGTYQKKDFFTKEQADILKAGKAVPTTNADTLTHNKGMEILLRDGDGLLIRPRKRSIHVARYYSSDRALDNGHDLYSSERNLTLRLK